MFLSADLHRYSGMNEKDVLAQLLPENTEVREFILSKYTWRFRTEVLPTVRSVAGARDLIATLKLQGAKIALATNCDREDLDRYRACLGADEYIDAIVCGDDVRRGKPHPDVVIAALKRLGCAPGEAVYVGDTPYDAEAARQARALFRRFERPFLARRSPRRRMPAIFLDPKSMSLAFTEPRAA
ncbi:MAG: HAD-IA family hydrolase [Xanthobacteraceae bacterium]